MKVLKFPPKYYDCHDCGNSVTETEITEVVEAGYAMLCESCEGKFWGAFYRAESAAEGER